MIALSILLCIYHFHPQVIAANGTHLPGLGQNVFHEVFRDREDHILYGVHRGIVCIAEEEERRIRRGHDRVKKEAGRGI